MATGPTREYDYSYNAAGQVLTISGVLGGTLPLARSNPGGSVAQPPGDASALGPPKSTLLTSYTYDAFGNLSGATGANGQCTSIGYDALFSELPTSTTVYVNGCGSPGGLVTTHKFDRGSRRVTWEVAPGGQTSMAKYDDFGRVSFFYRPDATIVGMPSTPYTLKADYTDVGPVRTAHVQTIDGDEETPTPVDHYRFVDGFGDVVAAVDQAGPMTGRSTWIVSGVHTRYENGLTYHQYKPFYWTGNGASFPADTFAYSSPTRTFAYDGLGRIVLSTDFDGNPQTYTYHPASLSVDIRDAEQLSGSHTGSLSTITMDGHGRVVSSDQHLAAASQGAGDVVTSTVYQATGEITSVTQTYPGGSATRWMQYDSLGRMVFNAEPNSSTNFSPVPGAAGVAGWTYAYNVSGELVGTSDARGCGENISYDGAGRVVQEDYSPCEPTQPAYSTPDPAGSGDGTEAFYRYDPVSGRLTDAYDRAQHSTFSYDARGRVNAVAKQIATPSGSDYLSERYTPHVFGRGYTYYSSNRLATESTGADLPELVQNGSSVSVTYTYEGAVQSLASSYGALIASQDVDPTGAVTHQVFGDAASTTADLLYDSNGSLTQYYVHRPAGPWVSSASDPPPGASDPNTLQGDLTNVVVKYDTVGNPLSMADSVDPSTWPSGAKPPSRSISYYDDYRVHDVSTNYAGTDDSFQSPYVATDGQTFPAPALPPNRVRDQQFSYDWLGNTVSTSDDVPVFVDRSLGTVTNGTSGSGPGRLLSAVSTDGAQSLQASYDHAGNMTGWNRLHGAGVATDGSTAVADNQYTYTWDEVGRLASASRQDASGFSISETFAYTSGGQRVIAWRQDSSGTNDYTVNVFDSLALQHTAFENGDYQRTTASEHLYLGGGTAHVFYAQDSLPTASSGQLHVFFLVADPLGSTSFVIDRDTGEVVEHATYLAYGGVESDYRPARWDSFREDIRYTGHYDDAEVGLVYFGARYYAPQLGRWISPDPLAVHGLAGDPNPYAFVRGSPIGNTDPLGLDPSDTSGCDNLSPGCNGGSDDSGGGFLGAIDDAGNAIGNWVSNGVSGLFGGGGGSGGGGGGGGGAPRSAPPPPAPVNNSVAGSVDLPDYSNTDAMGNPIGDGGLAGLGRFASGTGTGAYNMAIDAATMFPAINAVATGNLELAGFVTSVANGAKASSPVSPEGKAGVVMAVIASVVAPMARGTSTVGAGGMVVGSGGADIQAATVLREIAYGEKIADIVSEVSDLREATGLEYAVVSRPDGTRALVYGGSEGIDFTEFPLQRILGHSHPLGFPTPSAADFGLLEALGQRSSWLLEGNLIRFGVRPVP